MRFRLIILMLCMVAVAHGAGAAGASIPAAPTAAQRLLLPAPASPGIVLPRPPADLKGVPARAGWLVEHYWDLTNFDELFPVNQNEASTARKNEHSSASTTANEEVEQAFVNYLSLFPLTESDSLCRAAVAGLVGKIDETEAAEPFFDLAEKYLYDLNSPLANEEHYLYFIDAGLQSKHMQTARKAALRSQMRIILNNRVGTPVEEFSFELPSGALRDFSEIQGKRMLLLYEIGCENCMAMIEKLRTEALEDVTIVAIALNATRESFREFAKTLPADWVKGFDSTLTINGGAFAVRKLPDLFLISEDGTVLGKHLNHE